MLEKQLYEMLDGGSYSDWKTMIHQASAVPFVVETDGGSVTIDAQPALLASPDDRVDRVDEVAHVNDGNAELAAWLIARGVRPRMYMGASGDCAFFEHVVTPGERIEVLGRVVETTGVAASGYRDAATRTKVIVGTPADPCVMLRPRG